MLLINASVYKIAANIFEYKRRIRRNWFNPFTENEFIRHQVKMNCRLARQRILNSLVGVDFDAMSMDIQWAIAALPRSR